MAVAVQEVVVPDIGDFKNIEIIEVLVKPGDVIQPEDSLITLESDKAAMEVPSPLGGVVKSLKVKPGDKVNKGSPILTLEVAEAGASAQPQPAPPAPPVAVVPETPAPATAPVAPPPPAATASAGPVEQEVVVPDIGDFKDIEIIEVLVKPGDRIEAEASLITLESDKAAMEVPSPYAGLVKAVKVKSGDRVNKGTPILVLETQDTAAAPQAVPVAVETAAAEIKASAAQEAPERVRPVAVAGGETTGDRKTPPHASPAIRRYARELGANLERIQGSGPKGRILKEDVQRFVKDSLQRAEQAATAPAAPGGAFALPPIPEVDFSKFGPVETLALTRIQKLSGPFLHRNWVGIPHITQHDEADITDLEDFRKALKAEAEKKGIKLSFLPFVLKALVASLKAFPSFNASLAADGQSLILKRYFHIGVAVDTPEGLVVPVLRDVDRKSVFDLAAELAELSQKARNKKLRGPDLEGGCFTISSLGGIGGTAFTPIINAPEVAILGLSKSQMKPVWQDGQFVPRLMLPLSLSYDHRVIDGAQAARFIVHLGAMLADLRRVLL
ncbi:pyruvate dehydrogenase E2 component (dihydrolipoamide acetyltransferase) [Methylomagnum ishizawai]|uniref:Acetyltransferase component of pyruvate dehydrogenase complex n=1 Tax=Methylomagnum ishizawai TaxID=1760988 RepID=A0A1Y6CX67_9GAMM|nr:pyruvate dehydrogenase E2 component (dihydrolipoamide acetyltransferase) [Methylomagnum ishizawai]